MEPTAPSDHWLDWFSEDPSSSRPQRSTLTTPHHRNSTPADITEKRQRQYCDQSSEQENSSNLETTSLSRHSIPHRDQDRDRLPPQQQNTTRSRWRWSIWSTENTRTFPRRNKEKDSTATFTERTPRNRHSWLDRHKRRTYPPRALRVLKQEQKRLTQRKGGKKSKMYRLIGASNSSNSNSTGNTDKKQRDAFFQPPVRRRRHSLNGVLTSFVHSDSSLSPPLSSNTDQSGAQSGSSGADGSSSSSSRFQRTGLPSYLSSQQMPSSSSRKSVKATPTVRSSMVLQYTYDDDDDEEDDDATSLRFPDVVYHGRNDHSKSTLGSGSTSGNKSISSRRRQKQRLKVSHQESSSSNHWFSNWILHHPRRRQNRHNEKKNRRKRHASMMVTMNNNGSSSKIHPSPTPTTTTHSSEKDEKNATGLKKTLPFLRYATLSDLSSLSSSNPSQTLKPAHPSALDLPQLSNARPPPAYRFSVFWKSSTGKSGKQVIHVDERGHAGHATVCSKWETCNHEKSACILATLFITGFLICPLWWVGAALYLTKSSWFNQDLQVVYLWTPRTFGHLNCWMSAVSLLLLGLVAGLAIWYHLVVV